MTTNPKPLILTIDSSAGIDSPEVLLKLLEDHILSIKSGLIRDIEQRQRLSQKLCDKYTALFQDREITVFPKPLSTKQADTRFLAPRHLAHLLSDQLPREEANELLLASPDNGSLDSQSPGLIEPQAPAADIEAPSQIEAPPQIEAPAGSRWRRFLQAIKVAVILVGLLGGLFTSHSKTQSLRLDRALPRTSHNAGSKPRAGFRTPGETISRVLKVELASCEIEGSRRIGSPKSHLGSSANRPDIWLDHCPRSSQRALNELCGARPSDHWLNRESIQNLWPG